MDYLPVIFKQTNQVCSCHFSQDAKAQSFLLVRGSTSAARHHSMTSATVSRQLGRRRNCRGGTQSRTKDPPGDFSLSHKIKINSALLQNTEHIYHLISNQTRQQTETCLGHSTQRHVILHLHSTPEPADQSPTVSDSDDAHVRGKHLLFLFAHIYINTYI